MLTDHVVDWLHGERSPQRRLDVLIKLGQFSAARLLPEATQEQWDAAIDAAIKSGLVVEVNGRLSVKQQAKQQSEQMGLFE